MKLQQKYDSLGKIRSEALLAADTRNIAATGVPRGYVQMTSAVTSRHEASPSHHEAKLRARTLQHVPSRTSSLPRSRDVTDASRTLERAPKFSEILQSHSPARSFSSSIDSQCPDLQALLSHDYRLKPEVKEKSWMLENKPETMSYAATLPPKPERAAWAEASVAQEERQRVFSKDPKPQSVMTPSCDCPEPMLSEHELLQVDIFYRSHTSKVFVSRSAAHMYFGSARSMTRSIDDACATRGSVSTSHWHAIKAGVPLLLLDGVGSGSRAERKLHLVFAERGTGFALWRDVMSHTSNYNALMPDLHTLRSSRDPSQLVAFKFFDRDGAKDFFQKFHTVITHPEYEDILNVGGKKKKVSKSNSSGKKAKLPNKAAISGPCCFTHITSLDRENPDDAK